MSQAQREAMQAGLDRYYEAKREQDREDWATYREFLARDAEAFATTGHGLSWANVKIPRGAEHS